MATFGELLRQHRIAAGMTQEVLAEAARCSVAGIAALERGRRTRPRLHTVTLLADALALEPDERAMLLAAVAEQGGAPPTAAATAPATHRAALPLGFDPTGRAPLVGRSDDLSALAHWSTTTRSLRVVVGAPGVGKTRLVGELAARAAADGVRLLGGRCPEEADEPFRPITEVLRGALAALSPAAVAAALAGNGALLALLPELDRVVPGLAAAPSGDALTERRQLFDAAARLLGACAPLLVLLDDLHWLDASSAALLVHLLTGAPTAGSDAPAVLATARPAPPGSSWAAAQAALARAGVLERHDLGALDRDALAALLVNAMDGRQPDAALVDHIEAATAGNAYFAEELVTHLLDSGAITTAEGTAGLRPGLEAATTVPERVRETLQHRLAPLSVEASALLGAGAVLGREFEPFSAGRLIDAPRANVLDAVDELLATGLVNESPTGRLWFGHALAHAAVLDGLSQLRRAELHRRAALALEAAADASTGDAGPTSGTEPVGVDGAVAGAARHWRAALPVDPALAGRAALWAGRAGDRALAAAAFDEAVAAFGDAVRLLDDAGASAAELVAALLRWGDALRYVGRRDEADDAFRRALVEASAAGDQTLRARAAMGIGRLYAYGEMDPARVDTIVEVLDGLPADEPVWRPALASMVVSLVEFDDRPEVRALRARMRAIVVPGGREVQAELAEQLAHARPYLTIEDPALLAPVADAVVAAGRRHGDRLAEANGWFGRAWAALAAGDRTAFDAAVGHHRRLAEALAIPEEQAFADVFAATTAQIEGRYEDQRRHSEAAQRTNEQVGSPNGFLMFAGQLVLRSLDLGEAAAILPYLRALVADQPRISSFAGGLALTAALCGEEAEAREVLDRFARAGFDAIARDANWHAVVSGLAHAAAVIGDARHAPALGELLASSRAVAVRVGPIVGWWGPVALHLGALARLAGRHERAAAYLSAAQRINEGMGARPFIARTLLEEARLLAARGRPEATVAIARAATIAAQVGAAGIAADAAALRERVG